MGRSAKPTCQRCARPHPATVTETFSFSGSTYEIDLCEAQADALYRDLFAWGRLGRDVSNIARTQRTEEERRATISFPMARRVEVLDPPEKKTTIRTMTSTLPARAEAWRLTTHAQERCQQRGITREQALWAAVDPATDLPSIADHPSLRVRKRADVIAVVNADEQRVITVYSATSPEYEQKQEIEFATGHEHAA